MKHQWVKCKNGMCVCVCDAEWATLIIIILDRLEDILC